MQPHFLQALTPSGLFSRFLTEAVDAGTRRRYSAPRVEWETNDCSGLRPDRITAVFLPWRTSGQGYVASARKFFCAAINSVKRRIDA